MGSPLDGKSILVTGGTGFIGSELLRRLATNTTLKLKVISRKKKRESVYSNVEFIQWDLTDKKSVGQVLNSVGAADYAVHLAAETPRRRPEVDDEFFEVNLRGTVNLLKSMPATLRGFVCASTIDVYGIPRYNPIDEEHPTNPTTSYGVSKLAAEKYCTAFLASREIPCTILRYSQVYGPGEPIVNAIPSFIEAMLKGNLPILYGAGTDIRDYVYVGDVADATAFALERNLGGIFNIGTGKGHSVKEVLIAIADEVGVDLKPIERPRIGAPYDQVFDISRARKTLGYHPIQNMREGLRKQIRQMKDSLD